MVKIGLKKRDTITLKTVPLGRSGWYPGGVQGVEPLPKPPKKNTEQPPALRSPYRTARKRRGVVLGPPYARGASGAQMDPPIDQNTRRGSLGGKTPSFVHTAGMQHAPP